MARSPATEIETVLSDPNGAYQRLRRVMDAWCALWFWPLTEAGVTVHGADGAASAEPPTMERVDRRPAGVVGSGTRGPQPGTQHQPHACCFNRLGRTR